MSLVTLKGTINTYVFDTNDNIGLGGTSIVFKGKDIVSGELIAVKVLHRNLSSDESIISRLRQEASLKFSHPNLLRIYDLIIDNETNTYHLITEFVAGETLATIIKRTNGNSSFLPFKIVKKVGLEIGAALAYLHSQSPPIIHRDVNPTNIMITPEGNTKLMDLGIARVLDSTALARGNTKVGSIIGTYHYIPPEQLNAAQYGQISTRSDIFSLGVTLYEALTGKLPFKGNSEYQLFQSILNDSLKKESIINNQVFNLLQNATAKQPKDRYQSINDFTADFNKFDDDGRLIGVIRTLGKRIAKPILVAALGLIFLSTIGMVIYKKSKTKADSDDKIALNCPSISRIICIQSNINSDTLNLIKNYKENVQKRIDYLKQWKYWIENPSSFDGKIDKTGITTNEINFSSAISKFLVRLISETPMYTKTKKLDLINNVVGWTDENNLVKAAKSGLDEGTSLINKLKSDVEINKYKYKYFVNSIAEKYIQTCNLDQLLVLARETENLPLTLRAYYLLGDMSSAESVLKNLAPIEKSRFDIQLLEADIHALKSEYDYASNTYLSLIDSFRTDSTRYKYVLLSDADMNRVISRTNYLYDTTFFKYVKGFKYGIYSQKDTTYRSISKAWLECFLFNAENSKYASLKNFATVRLKTL